MSLIQDSAPNLSKDYYTSDYPIDMPPAYVADEIEMPVLNQPAGEGEDGGNDAVVQQEVSYCHPEILYCLLC